MASWVKVTTDQAPTPIAEKRQRPGWIPRLLDINPYKTVQKSTYPPPDGYSKDYEDTNSFEELFGQQYHPSTGNEDKYERYQYSQKDDDFSKDIHRDKLYLQFYQQLEKEFDKDRPSDCVIVSISKDQAEYSTAIGHRLQDHGLVVEMIYLTSESGLTRALQEVKNDGSPFCVLVEPSNVALCSCTVIMLHQSIKIHRNMPMEDALALIAKEYEKIFADREQQERAEISHKAADLADDYLERELCESYHVPLGIRHLLFLLSEGKHLFLEELNSISDYLKTRRNKLEGFVAEPVPLPSAVEDAVFPPSARPSTSALPQTLSKPPPLLPTPSRNSAMGQSAVVPAAKPALLGDRPLGGRLPAPGPKGKPPPLLTQSAKRPIVLGPSSHLPAKRPLLGRPGLLPTPAQARSAQHHWVPKPKFLA
ncbi:PREDICTED: nuclear receptor coactivator 5-like isoform X1 [Gekko japonicus]|uniref:Nuclear receptor coactivator 5-like isoform X1 n=1 Tax=Gekko japonicus TaxID=146911 RepID=A0ABM1KM03_GEKJA|nr:PREDICTED: nuclear receptor coactivator 5-like isoform X1 [Gekko japonicus]